MEAGGRHAAVPAAGAIAEHPGAGAGRVELRGDRALQGGHPSPRCAAAVDRLRRALLAAVQQQVREPESVGGVQRNAARARCVLEPAPVAIHAVSPRLPLHRIAELHQQVLLEFHADQLSEHDRRDMRRGRRIRVTFTRLAPQRSANRRHIHAHALLLVALEGNAHGKWGS